MIDEDKKSVELRVIRSGPKSERLNQGSVKRLLSWVEEHYKKKGYAVFLAD